MRLCRIDEIQVSRADGVFRESPLWKFIGMLLCAGLTAIPIAIALRDRSLTGAIVLWAAAGFMVLITLVFLRLWLRTLSPDNWVVAITSSGDVAIKMRSFANAHLPREDRVVIV